MRRVGTVAVIAMVLLPASPEGARAVQRLIDLRQIPTDTLRDVAVAAFVGGRPTIFYNPALLQRFGPRMTEFFLAHEYGHIRYGHTGGALADVDGELSLLRQRQELEADCYAAGLLAGTDRESVEEALRFFSRMGPYRYDPYHPTGAQRAAKILACLPAEPADSDLGPEPAAPLSGREISFTVRSPAPSAGEYAVEARLWIDDTPVGVVSSLRQPASVELRQFAAGTHRYRIAATLYGLDAMLQLNQGGSAGGDGVLTVSQGDVFSVRWRPGEAPVLVRARIAIPTLTADGR